MDSNYLVVVIGDSKEKEIEIQVLKIEDNSVFGELSFKLIDIDEVRNIDISN